MFLTKKAFQLAMTARLADENAYQTDRLQSLQHELHNRLNAQEKSILQLNTELGKRDQVLAENTRRINALMAFAGVEEHKVPAAPEVTVYTQEVRP